MLIETQENPNEFRMHGESITADEIIQTALAIINARFKRGASFNNPDAARHFFKFKLGQADREVFGVAFLDSKHRLIAFEELFAGGLISVGVHPGVIVKRALIHNSSAVILAHSHPTGDCTPSAEDLTTTQTVKRALELVDVKLVDHFIVGKHCYSMYDNGQI